MAILGAHIKFLALINIKKEGPRFGQMKLVLMAQFRCIN